MLLWVPLVPRFPGFLLLSFLFFHKTKCKTGEKIFPEGIQGYMQKLQWIWAQTTKFDLKCTIKVSYARSPSINYYNLNVFSKLITSQLWRWLSIKYITVATISIVVVAVCATLQFTYVDTYPDDPPVIEVPSYDGMDSSDVESLQEFLYQEVIFLLFSLVLT